MNRNNLLRRHFRPLARKAGPPEEARLYTLRHTFATLWMESNEPVKILQQILGHSRIDQTMNTYAHVMPHIQADAFGRFSKRFSQRQAVKPALRRMGQKPNPRFAGFSLARSAGLEPATF
jgi:integrase